MAELFFPAPAPDFLATYVQARNAGMANALQTARRNALAEVSTDPEAAETDLLRAGDLQDAAGLANLRYTQAQRQLVTNAYNALNPQPPAPSTPPTSVTGTATGQPPTAAAPEAPQPTPQQVDPAAATAKLDAVEGIVSKVAAVPYEQRKVALQAFAPQLAQVGFSADQVAQFDPTDQNLAAIGQQVTQLRSHIAGQSGAPQPQGAPAPQTAAAPPPAVQPAPQAEAPQTPGLDLRNPRTQQALEALAIGAPQTASALTSLGSAVMPQYDATRSGVIYDKRSGKITNSGPNEQGIEYDLSGGKIIGAHNVPGFSEATAEQERAREAAKQGVDVQFAGPRAYAEASGHAGGEAPYKILNIPQSDGSTLSGFVHVGKDGQSYFVPLQAGPGAQAPAAPGQPAPSVGRSQNTNQHEFAQRDAAEFMDTLAKEASPEQQVHLQGAIASAQQAVKSAMALDPTMWTPTDKRVAEILNTVGLDKNKANDLNYYATLIPQITRGSFSTFPRLEKEFELVKDAIPSLKTPRDAAALTFATIAATNQRNLDFAKFANDFSGAGNPSEAALNRAWQASPLGRRSIFADPVFQGLQIDGKPAVYVNPQAAPNGHSYGVFRPGTPYAQTFLVN